MKEFLKRFRSQLIQLLVSVLLTAAACFVPVENEWLKTLLFIPGYIVAAYPVFRKAFGNICRGDIFDENFLMLIASLGALVIHDNIEASAVMIFYRVGEMFEHFAVERSRKDIAAIMDIRVPTARVVADGEQKTVDAEDVQVGDIILVLPGEKIPVDGVVTEGSSDVDTSSMTGESIPVSVGEGNEVTGGCVNLTGTLHIRATKEYDENTVMKILSIIENSSLRKAETENFISRFAKIYTPAVVAAAVLTILIPGLVTGQWAQWFHRALTFLVISCPCALVISVPLGYFSGIGGASKKGILIKGGICMESLAKADTVVFDKTGTLTEGRFSVSAVAPAEGCDEKTLIAKAAEAEKFSLHPIAEALRKGAGCDLNEDTGSAEEIAGMGVRYTGKTVICAGNRKLMNKESVRVPDEFADVEASAAGTVIHVAENGRYLGCVTVGDTLRKNSAATVAALNNAGIKTVMLTGDNEVTARAVASKVGIKEVKAGLLPEDKAQAVAEMTRNGKVAFVGDGINDAPVLTVADAGIAMGGIGSDAAIEAADIVITNDDPAKVLQAVTLSRKTQRIVKENIWFALTVKFVILVLGFFGIAGMWGAVFADVGVSVIAICNSMRALK